MAPGWTCRHGKSLGLTCYECRYELMKDNRAIMESTAPGGLFCEHGVYMGDANPNRPCPECASGVWEGGSSESPSPSPGEERTVKRIPGWVLALLYIGAIVAADYLAAKWIFHLPFGLLTPAGVFAIAPVFTLRDQIHERWGRRGAYALIAVASLISYLVSVWLGLPALAKVTLASVLAFVAGETLDTEVFARLRPYSKAVAIFGSNVVSAFVDSYVFIVVAFGTVWPLILGQYVMKLLIASVWTVWALYEQPEKEAVLA